MHIISCIINSWPGRLDTTFLETPRSPPVEPQDWSAPNGKFEIREHFHSVITFKTVLLFLHFLSDTFYSFFNFIIWRFRCWHCRYMGGGLQMERQRPRGWQGRLCSPALQAAWESRAQPGPWIASLGAKSF